MKHTNRTLLQFADREPYEPVTELIDVPAAFLEVVTLADKAAAGDAASATKIKHLMTSVIDVVLADPESLLKLDDLARGGYRIAFLPMESAVIAAEG